MNTLINLTEKVQYNDIMVQECWGHYDIILPNGIIIRGKGPDLYRSLLNAADKLRSAYSEKGLDFLLDKRT